MTTASPGSAPAINTGRVTSCPPRIRGVIIGPQHPGAVFPTIVPPSINGPSIGFAGSKMPSVSSDTRTVRLPLFGSSATFMILFLRLDLPGDLNGYQFTGFRQAFNVQRSTFGGAGCRQDIGNSFALSPVLFCLDLNGRSCTNA